MIKNIKDYLPKLEEMFPTLHKLDIKRMVEYGWRMFYYYNLRNCDTLIESNKYKFWMYCGKMFYDSQLHFNYYKEKLCKRLRVMFIKKKKLWDGYYYIGLTQEEYNKINKIGRKRKHFKYKNKIIFKLYAEAKLRYSNAKCIARFKYPADMGWTFYKENLEISDMEIVLVRDRPDTFKDIMISNDNYNIL